MKILIIKEQQWIVDFIIKNKNKKADIISNHLVLKINLVLTCLLRLSKKQNNLLIKGQDQ